MAAVIVNSFLWYVVLGTSGIVLEDCRHILECREIETSATPTKVNEREVIPL